MTYSEVKDLIGKENLAKFDKWMAGQTVGVYESGAIDYYSHDVMAFMDILQGKPDRQEDPLRWD